MTGRLSLLRSRLARLRRVRATLRAVSAWTPLVTAQLLALFCVFAVDWLFDLPVSQRVVVMVLGGVGVLYAFARLTRPLLGRQESEIDVALVVERQHEIDSDLVAAIQFERAGAMALGSQQLAGAVVEYVAQAAPRINVFQGLSTEQLLKRLAALAASLVVAGGLAIFAPGHLAAFANRLCLGSRHYPTRTRIEQIVVNGVAVLSPGRQELAPDEAQGAQGQALAFTVVCSGSLPGDGQVEIRPARGSGAGTRLSLKPLTANELAAASATELERALGETPANVSGKSVYRGELGRLNEDVTYQVIAGDARTDAGQVRMIPLPILELKLSAEPPAYAAAQAAPLDSSGRQAALLEGSSVNLSLECVNQKPLRAVALSVHTAGADARIELTPLDEQRLCWSLPAKNSALTNLRREVRYEVEAVDMDGLSTQTPIRGTIRVRPDQTPSGVAAVVHRVVLPTAAPVVTFRATDDFGIAGLALVVDVERASAEAAALRATEVPESELTRVAPPAAVVAAETHRLNIPLAQTPLGGERLPTSGTYSLSLGQLGLLKGDRLKVALEVTDFRGQNGAGQQIGVAALSEALVLEVSDESGVLAAIAEADQRSEAQLSEIIKRQLGIGQEP